MRNVLPVSDFNTIWRVVNYHWICVSDPSITDSLSKYLWDHGFDIPETITYCLAENNKYKLKFRVCGGQISVFIHSF